MARLGWMFISKGAAGLRFHLHGMALVQRIMIESKLHDAKEIFSNMLVTHPCQRTQQKSEMSAALSDHLLGKVITIKDSKHLRQWCHLLRSAYKKETA
jgi:hypothetical protein